MIFFPPLFAQSVSFAPIVLLSACQIECIYLFSGKQSIKFSPLGKRCLALLVPTMKTTSNQWPKATLSGPLMWEALCGRRYKKPLTTTCHQNLRIKDKLTVNGPCSMDSVPNCHMRCSWMLIICLWALVIMKNKDRIKIKPKIVNAVGIQEPGRLKQNQNRLLAD